MPLAHFLYAQTLSGSSPPSSRHGGRLHKTKTPKRLLGCLARRKGLEPLTYWFVASHSIQLSYWRIHLQDARVILSHLKAFVKHFLSVLRKFFLFFLFHPLIPFARHLFMSRANWPITLFCTKTAAACTQIAQAAVFFILFRYKARL